MHTYQAKGIRISGRGYGSHEKSRYRTHRGNDKKHHRGNQRSVVNQLNPKGGVIREFFNNFKKNLLTLPLCPYDNGMFEGQSEERKVKHMPLVNPNTLFKHALENGYAIGAFNVNNMEIIQGIIDGITEERAPAILQFSRGGRSYARVEYISKLVEAALETTDIPIAVNLDHGDDVELCKACVDQGFTMVMYDGSHLPLEENIANTREVVEYAHAKDVAVEAEIGRLKGIEDNISVSEKDAILTDPEEAKQMVTESGCDCLAIAIGTSHGAYKFKGGAKLYFDRLEEIQKVLPDFPLVLHGASSVLKEFVDKCNEYGGDIKGAAGVPEDMIAQAAAQNVCKVNIDTDIRLAVTSSIREQFTKNPAEFDPRKYLGPAREAIKDMVRRKVKLLGSAGKAEEVLDILGQNP
jgi:fructose-bisphosphate aldolase class II